MKEFEPKALKEQDLSFDSGLGSKRFWKRVGLIAAGVGVGAVLLLSII